MGLKVKYTIADGEGFEQTFSDAYIRIIKVHTSNSDYEFFERVDDPEYPEIAERLTWTKRLENVATVYIYTDLDARERMMSPIHWFKLNFTYDLDSNSNIFAQAYDTLKKMFEIHEDIL